MRKVIWSYATTCCFKFCLVG